MREKINKSQHLRAERPRARTLSHNKRTRNPKHGARDRTVGNGFTAETERDTGTAALARVPSGPLVVPAGRQGAPRDGDGLLSAAAVAAADPFQAVAAAPGYGYPVIIRRHRRRRTPYGSRTDVSLRHPNVRYIISCRYVFFPVCFSLRNRCVI